ncbi:MAG: 2-oxo acid dehydrogenase subunit E2 [Chthoniobacterales bacterium]|nr:2-oxo acid dehydrogenase subunit E2 [Chthoniobacterales bacterium]
MPEITMPKLSDTMTEGTLLRWCKQKGDPIEIGDLLAEVETDKATMEMEAFEEGILSELFVEEGAKVPVGSPIAFILGKNETLTERSPSTSPLTPPPSSTSNSLTPQAITPGSSRQAVPSNTTISSIRIKVSPLARKIAAERGLRLETVAGKGTGPGGRIIAADVIHAPLTPIPTSTGTASSSSILPTPISGNPHTEIPLTNMRQIIAQRLLASKTDIPHFYLSIEIDAAPMVAFRKEFNATGNKITFNDIVLLAVARAAIEKPKINAAFGTTSIFQYESVNLSVAIAVEEGLVTPVIRDAHLKSLPEISAAVKDLATRAREKKLKPEEFSGGTITVSNLGAYGINQFCAIINPPQAAILAVGAIVKKPVVDAQDQIVIGQRLSITLSGDHRVVDGAVAAEYLAALRLLLESPSRLLTV